MSKNKEKKYKAVLNYDKNIPRKKMKNLKINKQKCFEILITAILSAIIAILQNIVLGIGHSAPAVDVPATAGVMGAVAMGIRHSFHA